MCRFDDIINMPTCAKCQGSLTTEDSKAKIICDSCRGCFCLACSDLTASEVKVMQLVGKRILKFYCIKCDGSEIKALSKEFNSKFEELRQDFLESFLSIQKKVDESTAALNSDINNITITNKEVIHKLTSGNAPLNPSNSDELKNMPPGPPVSLSTSDSGPNNVPTTINDNNPNRGRFNSRHRGNTRINQERTDIIQSSTSTHSSATPHVVKGSGSGDSTTSFASAARRIWLSVSRVKIGTSVNDISAYLEGKYPGYVFTVELQPKRPEATSLAFKVSADPNLYNDLYKGENWPNGIYVKRFSFRRTNNAAQQWS